LRRGAPAGWEQPDKSGYVENEEIKSYNNYIQKGMGSAYSGWGKIESQKSVYEKLDKYLLNFEHPRGQSKAYWFKQALGFTKANMNQLAKQIVFDPNQAVLTKQTEYGQLYNQIITIDGSNQKKIDVVFCWIRNNDNVVRLVTAIPTKNRYGEIYMINTYDIVRASRDLSSTVKAGATGTVLQVYNDKPIPYFLVEFMDSNNDFADLVTASEHDIIPISITPDKG
jgi:hypothetical protein